MTPGHLAYFFATAQSLLSIFTKGHLRGDLVVVALLDIYLGWEQSTVFEISLNISF